MLQPREARERGWQRGSKGITRHNPELGITLHERGWRILSEYASDTLPTTVTAARHGFEDSFFSIREVEMFRILRSRRPHRQEAT